MTLKKKVKNIEKALEKMLLSRNFKPMIWSLGAYDIVPKCLVFVVGVNTDEIKIMLKNDDEFGASMKRLLDEFDWPIKARDAVVFDIESQETVDRESNGNW